MAKKKFDMGKVLGKTAAAAGAGFAADKVQDILINNIDFVNKNPGIAPGIVAAGAFAALYFMDDEYVHAAAYGAIGSVGAQVGDLLIPMNGFSRVVYSNNGEPVGRFGGRGRLAQRLRQQRGNQRGMKTFSQMIPARVRERMQSNIAENMCLPMQFEYSEDATE